MNELRKFTLIWTRISSAMVNRNVQLFWLLNRFSRTSASKLLAQMKNTLIERQLVPWLDSDLTDRDDDSTKFIIRWNNQITRAWLCIQWMALAHSTSKYNPTLLQKDAKKPHQFSTSFRIYIRLIRNVDTDTRNSNLTTCRSSHKLETRSIKTLPSPRNRKNELVHQNQLLFTGSTKIIIDSLFKYRINMVSTGTLYTKGAEDVRVLAYSTLVHVLVSTQFLYVCGYT